jgi:hypothetical protein
MQLDLFDKSESFEALITRRLPTSELLVVSDVASALDITRTKVLDLMDEGLIRAINLNAGTSLRPFYKVTRESVIAYARRLDQGW